MNNQTRELRILNGLHRGATLPLDGSTLLLGAHEDADVVMVDPGIVAHHASLQSSDDGWILTADAGQVFNADSLAPQATVELWSGSYFRIGATWLMISEAGAAWQDLPSMPEPEQQSEPEPEPQPQPWNDHDDVSAVDTEADVYAAEDDIYARSGADDPAATALADDPDAEPKIVTAETVETVTAGRRRWHNWMYAPVAALATLSAVAAYAYSAKPSLPALPTLPTIQLSTSIGADSALARRPSVVDTAAMAPPAVRPVGLDPEQLRAAFRKRMKDAELLQQFDLDLNDDGWSMRAHLDDAESARFERILKAFVNEHKITFPISAKVGNAESMLPFKIRQVVSGVNAGIVTGDGDRFYVGDEFLGVRLVAVDDNRLTFMGKRKIEVIW